MIDSMSQHTVLLSRSKLHSAMKRARINSYAQLLSKSLVHRNTLYHYLSGKRAVVAEPVQRIAKILGVDCLSLLESSSAQSRDEDFLITILNQLAQEHPSVAFILLGSRIKGAAHKYSDWDIGISGGRTAIDPTAYLSIKGSIQDLTEQWTYLVDVVNLDCAPAWFLRGIDYEPRLLAGNLENYHYFSGVLNGCRKEAAVA